MVYGAGIHTVSASKNRIRGASLRTDMANMAARGGAPGFYSNS